MRILIEASGCLTSGYIIQAIKEAGHFVVGSDINKNNASAYICDDFIEFPLKDDTNLWGKVKNLLLKNKIDIVIPSFDEMMIGWSKRKEYFEKLGIKIIISPINTISIFQNKWETYLFFQQYNIPTPKTSLKQEYPLIKPVVGRGSKGIFVSKNNINMNGYISQEIVDGEEYTIDAFFDYLGHPVYIIPRKRIDIKEGKSTKGIVIKNEAIEQYIKHIHENTIFIGPINFQCFVKDKDIKFIEINPRIAGGMALSFAASENWIRLIIDNIIYKKQLIPKPIKYNLKMYRYYAETFVS